MNKQTIQEFVEHWLEENHPAVFPVDIKISAANDIEIDVAAPDGVDIDTCVELSKAFEEAFDREAEDYSLQVGSAGITEPFKVWRQYDMNIGNEVEVLASDGKKYRGVLDAVGENSFTVLVPTKIKEEGSKKARIEDVPMTFEMDKVKYTKYMLNF